MEPLKNIHPGVHAQMWILRGITFSCFSFLLLAALVRPVSDLLNAVWALTVLGLALLNMVLAAGFAIDEWRHFSKQPVAFLSTLILSALPALLIFSAVHLCK
jgi:hypothetical protein